MVPAGVGISGSPMTLYVLTTLSFQFDELYSRLRLKMELTKTGVYLA